MASDLILHRDHALGRARARDVARQWAAKAERKLQMTCTLTEGDDHDVLAFSRAGVDGRMLVTGSSFDLEATLGAMFRPFVGMVGAQVGQALDEAIASAA